MPELVLTSAVDLATQALLAAVDAGEYPAGAPLPAERNLAERLAVSRMTVRAVLAHLEHRGVVAPNPHGRGRIVAARIADEAPHPLMTRSVVVVSLLGRHGEPDAPPWYLRSDAAMVRELHARGCYALTIGADQLDAAQVEVLARSRPRGAVIGTGAEHALGRALARRLGDAGVPVVAAHDGEGFEHFHRVVFDHDTGGALLAEAMIARGCRRLLPMAVPGDPWWQQRRLAGITAALRRHGLPALPPVVLPPPPVGAEHRDRHEARARHCAGYLLDRLRPYGEPIDAILASTDWDVFPIATALRLMGLKPGVDVRLAGYDNYWAISGARAWEPTMPIASIDRGDEAQGRALAAAVVAPPKTPGRELIAPRLVTFAE